MSALSLPPSIRWLFLDLNSYFASVEQNENPQLRGKPVAVLPLMTDSTCVIAASYEAKAFGIKTGTPVWEAKRLCPNITLISGRHDMYVDYHHRILAAVDKHIPVTHICSIDEVACRLDPSEENVSTATKLAHAIKHELRESVGPAIRCSIGLASNKFLAKVATDMQKPDGLVVLEPHELPGRLFDLDLTDLCGIGERTARRLSAGGICTVEQLWQADPKYVRRLWGGIQGERFWYLLHGYDLPEVETHRSSLSHSQVLAPEVRPFHEARMVGRRLTQKLASRLRRLGYAGSHFALSMRTTAGRRWAAECAMPMNADNFTMLHAFESLWAAAEQELGTPQLRKVGVWLTGMMPEAEANTADLFSWQAQTPPPRQNKLSGVMDGLNKKFGKDTVLLGLPAKRLAHYTGTKVAFTRIPDKEEFWE
jgi:DNA polymerase IV